MAMADDLAKLRVSDLDLDRYVAVEPAQSVAETVRAMGDSDYSCACIVDDGDLIGLFTQRDVLMRVLGRPPVCDRPIGEEMTPTLRTMRADQSVAEGMAVMREWWVRNVPVLGDEGLVGNLSWYTVMRTMAGLLNRPEGEAQGEPGLQHGLAFVDFTGLHTSTPVLVPEDTTADVAAHHMRARAIGSVLVVDQREYLVGILTEFDLLKRFGCTAEDLADVAVAEMMEPDVVTLSARSSIADAIQQMADKGLSHAPLLGESSRPVGVASFRDIASYFETSIGSYT